MYCNWFWDGYWGHAGQLLVNSFSLSLATVTEVFANVNSAQFPSRMADCSNTAAEDAMRHITLPTHLLQVLYTFYSRHHQGPALGWVFSAETSRYQWCLQQTGKLIWKRISAVGLSQLIELIIASSRCLFQLVLHQKKKLKTNKWKRKKIIPFICLSFACLSFLSPESSKSSNLLRLVKGK